MCAVQVVVDTNVLLAGVRSRRGWSYRFLQLVGSGRFDINLSVPLVLEYEDVLRRELDNLLISSQAADDILDYFCVVAHHHRIFYLWRPFLQDPNDDMVLELAVKANCAYIVTVNKRDFRGIERFGISAVEPGEFLTLIGAVP